MRHSFLHTLYDICYLALLCGIILLTFYYVFLPAQPAITALSNQAIPTLQQINTKPLPTEISMLCAIGSLLYLKCIWQLIMR